MKNIIIKTIVFCLLLTSSLAHACGDNPNAMVQGPFKDSAFNNGFVCFQHSPDKRDIDFYLSYLSSSGERNDVIDTFNYSDAPAEVVSVFFTSVKGMRNVVVLLRWNVNYSTDGVEYPYYYEVKTYKPTEGAGYKLFLDSEKDPKLSGYQTNRGGKICNYQLDNASKIKQYLHSEYGM